MTILNLLWLLEFYLTMNHIASSSVLLQHEYTPMYHAAQDGQADFISMMIKEVPGLDLEFSTKVNNNRHSNYKHRLSFNFNNL